MAAERIVVTGLGALTPIGATAAESWQALLLGATGAVRLTEPWVAEITSQIAARVTVDPTQVIGRVTARRLDRSAQLGLVAALEAWRHAGLPKPGDPDGVPPERLGVVFGAGIGGLTTVMEQHNIVRERGPQRMNPLTVPMIMPNAPAAAVGLELGARAGVHAPVSACATSAEAIAMAASMLNEGRADVVVAGGTEAVINEIAMAAFAAMRALSTRNDDPGHASRPYDIDRDGFVLGEGAGALILEREGHARARGAVCHGVVAGWGMSADAHHIAAPDPDGVGAAAAMTAALRSAGADPADVVHVSAHATSTPLGDLAESRAIRRALGAAADSAAVSAPKSQIGHLLGGAGAVEAVLALCALRDCLAPGTRNIVTLDPAVDIDVVRGEARELSATRTRSGLALSNSFGFGGHNVSLAFSLA